MFIFVLIVMLVICPILPQAVYAEEEKGMHFTTAEWAYDVRGRADYDPNPAGVFARGERGYAYLELEGFEVGEDDGLYVVNLAVDVVLRTKGGLRLFTQKNLVEYDLAYTDSPPKNLWFYIWVDIPRWAPRAVYLAEVVVRDLISHETLTEGKEIRVE